jgi:hypothetical protein
MATTQVFVHVTSGTQWWVVAFSAGSALLGGVLGSLLTIWPEGKRSRARAAAAKTLRSQDAAQASSGSSPTAARPPTRAPSPCSGQASSAHRS